MEQPTEQILMRMLASLGSIDLTHLKSGLMDDEDWARATDASALLMGDLNDSLIIDDTGSLTPAMLRIRARRNARRYGHPSIIGLDYLQLMRCPDQENRTQEIAEISRSLKALAKEMMCPVVALSQLNRQLESRADKRPNNGDLRDSGAWSRTLTSSSLFIAMRSITKTPRIKGLLKSLSVNSARDPRGRSACSMKVVLPVFLTSRADRGGAHEQRP
jgi:replicative DNA helicase